MSLIWDILAYFYDKTIGLVIKVIDSVNASPDPSDIIWGFILIAALYVVFYIGVPTFAFILPATDKFYRAQMKYAGYKDKRFLRDLVIFLFWILAIHTFLIWCFTNVPYGYMPIPPVECIIIAFPILFLISKNAWK